MDASSIRRGDPYQAYLYSYPHKTAYRALSPPVSLAQTWADEGKDALFLYLHVPFCEMRCGFCNLFTASRPAPELVSAYLDALERQAGEVHDAIGPEGFSRVAVGGGTPTLLDEAGLSRLFGVIEGMGAANLPTSVECSPATVTTAKLRLLREHGVTRVSMGVQSFVEEEVSAVLRPQRTARVEAALTAMKELGFPVVNVDLIYGIDGQTVASWRRSLQRALAFAPDEVFLYPLYVRPLTGLGRKNQPPDVDRRTLYEVGRARLLEAGYEQRSMRYFRLPRQVEGPRYTCQEDGMVGLGCGARSYTRSLHYAAPFAVGAREIRQILAAWMPRDFGVVDWGMRLGPDEQRRRYLILSLLNADGLDLVDWRARFGPCPEVDALVVEGLVTVQADRACLSEEGVALSDAIGPWLHSPEVRARMDSWSPR